MESSNKKEVKNPKVLDFSSLTEKELSEVHGAGYNYCPKWDTTDSAKCCQSNSDSAGGWWCPH